MNKEMIFDMSSLIKDKSSLEEIEFWGHDAGEFVSQTTDVKQNTTISEIVDSNSRGTQN
jgi:hypothetical protein